MASLSLTSPIALHGFASSLSSPTKSASFSHVSLANPHLSRHVTKNPSRIVAMSNSSNVQAKDKDLSEKISSSIKDAEELCKADATSGECAAAWDEVEELSSTQAHKRVQAKSDTDPLEKFCKEQPEADECRVYED